MSAKSLRKIDQKERGTKITRKQSHRERTHLNRVIINFDVFIGAGDSAANVQLTDTAEPVPTKILC